MARVETHSINLSRNTAQILRIEQGVYKELLNYSGVIGKIGEIYQKGFDLIREDKSIIHFRGDPWLHSPFGVAIDQPISRWIERVPLREGDIFERTGGLLQRRTRDGCSIQLNPYYIIDLKRTLFFRPPERETLLLEIQLLSEEIFKWSRFEGMAGVLSLLSEGLPALAFASWIPMSFWGRHALPRVRKLISSVIHAKTPGDHLQAETYGIEIDRQRGKIARQKLTQCLITDYHAAHISPKFASLLWLNPPYDWSAREEEIERSERYERTFLRDTVKYLIPSGILVYLIPIRRLDATIARMLSYRFEKIRIYKFPEGLFSQFKKIVLFGVWEKTPFPDERTCE